MAFWLTCPNCGRRSVEEFRFGGEVLSRPDPKAPTSEWNDYFYNRKNIQGQQREWWYHRLGCRQWLIAERDTRDNTVVSTAWPGTANPENLQG